MDNDNRLMIYAGINGPFFTPLPRVISYNYIPVNILSDLCTEDEFRKGIDSDHDTTALVKWVFDQIRLRIRKLQHKHVYLSEGGSFSTFTGFIGIEDFGFLTRHLPLIHEDSWIITHWKQADRSMVEYNKFIVQLSIELESLLRSIFPRAGIIACETFDISHHTALAKFGPHPHFYQRWRRSSRKLFNDLPFIQATSLYRNVLTKEEYAHWVECQRAFADVAYITPFKHGTGLCGIEEFKETLTVVSTYFDTVVIWARPVSNEQAALVRALVGAVIS